ncbi:MAG TPA: peptide ABC transporter permease [Oceanospirillales bacterium]|jgi:putative ABC transport system permease protein|uniref:ABC transporter permease n=1 Tax=Thalassolituus sp. TaxID=2030822 RepID=UPI000C515ECA|nr:ABC transporter permease [Thalassolituus sp.]MAE35496.1 peptide ABC transporter permease [Oceanospirillaceae bacterium]MEE3160466.1 ABC transporter permease [Pseudomonadota bacterium]HCG79126.1 peptide ABC transporter permease [Oceanospirillales bacterium]MDQ4424774.1 ABC transporter permease [Thalassolituus sp.]MDQ4426737.1 ABC transporter permease [Thalassolituus sp.]|tara:strand:+ start:7 stop:1206 length:1200 start_codon:yes stop_codon:yes gene_type:complete
MIRPDDWLRLATSPVTSQPGKSVLTALGIAIGIAAVTLLTTLGHGVRQYVLDSFSQFGTRIIAITPGHSETAGLAGGLISSVRLLTLDDAEALSRITGSEWVVSNVQGSGPVRYGERVRSTEILGTTSDFNQAWDFPLAMGKFLPNADGNSPAVAVIGDTLYRELFRSENPLGKFIRIGGQRYRVIGVMQPKGSTLGFDLDDMAYIPADRALTLFNREGLMEVDVVFSEGTTSAQMQERIKSVMMKRHGQEDFTLTSQDEMLSSMNRILSILTMGVAALGGISLLVGGVGIFTIMTTNLTERTAEIGLLRAIGCPRRQLLSLFLGEAVMLSLFGAFIGIVITAVVVAFLSVLAPAFPVQIQFSTLGLAIAVATITGLISGIWPAYKSSRLSPIEALRGE